MADWDPPSDSELAPNKPGKPSLARRIRDLSIALAARESGTPWLNAAVQQVLIKDFGQQFLGVGQVIYTLAGSWTVPADVYWICVLAIGGGGAGGRAAGSFGFGGGGGAAEWCERTIPVTPGQEIPITIGAGGDKYEIHNSVDTSLDGFVIGTGGRTTFGVPPYHVMARGGRAAPDTSTVGDGGSGASGQPYSVVVDGVPTVVPRVAGANGWPAVISPVPSFQESGAGADSFFGGGGRGVRVQDAFILPQQKLFLTNAFAPGSGGGGAVKITAGEVRAGRGANGAVLIRY